MTKLQVPFLGSVFEAVLEVVTGEVAGGREGNCDGRLRSLTQG